MWRKNTVLHCARACLALIGLAFSVTAARAQDCKLPPSFQYQVPNNAAAWLSAANDGDRCSFSVTLNAGASATASGFLAYRRPKPTTSVRYGFRIDTSALTTAGAVRPRAQLFSVSSPVVVTTPVPSSHLLSVEYAGGGSVPKLVLLAAQGGNGVPLSVLVPTTQTVNTLRVEINVGVGSAGRVRYWLNVPFSHVPTGTIDNGGAGLDNVAWVGVVAAELGLSSSNDSFRSNYAGSAIVFDQIETNDDGLFWSDFESSSQ
jgi:hypothetical protein